MKTQRNPVSTMAVTLALLALHSTSTQPAKGADFVSVSPMNQARNFFTATLLLNGKVLVAGGFPNGSSAELYDPRADQWIVTGSLRAARVYHQATLLPNGKVLIAGSLQSGGGGRVGTSAELYDPATGTWALTGPMKNARSSSTAILLWNGKVLVTGGGTGSELYDPTTGTWTDTGSPSTFGAPPTLLLNGKVLAGAELYDPATGTWTPTGAPSRGYATATLLSNGKVLAAGGNRTFTAELYDPQTGKWSPTGSMIWDRDFCRATLLSNGQVMITGGYQQETDTPIPSAELYDPSNGTWTEIAMNSEHFSHAATLLADGKLLVSGGNGLGLQLLSSAEVYALDQPPSLMIFPNADQTATLSWRGAGALEQTDSLTALNWQPAPNQANPQVIKTTAALKFYRLKAE